MAFFWSLYCLCTTYGFRLIIVLSLYYLRLSFGHYIDSVLLTCFVWALYCLCSTYDFPLVIVLSLFYLRLSFGHCIVSVLLTAFAWSLYCHCTTYSFRLVIALSLYYLRFSVFIILSLYCSRLSFGHYIVSALLTAFVWSLYCFCTT
jgi:hypothetical protein